MISTPHESQLCRSRTFCGPSSFTMVVFETPLRLGSLDSDQFSYDVCLVECRQ